MARRPSPVWSVSSRSSLRASLSCALLACVAACQGRNGPRAEPAPPPPSAGEVATPVVAASATVLSTSAVQVASIARDASEPPLSLTTEDGNGLALAKLDAKVVVEGPLAFTELHLTFTNPDARVREGRFQITLPPGAAVNRFAMKNDGTWNEAEMVERQLARRAYEDALHKKTDPALLEKQAGNQFAARVFPIPASATKELVVSYVEEVGDGAYVLPLRGLPAIGEVTASAKVLRADRAQKYDETALHERAWTPDRDFAVAATGRPQAVASGELVAARVVPELGVGKASFAAATILVDDSASRALGWDRTVDDLGEMISTIAKDDGDPAITVAAFDQEVAPIYEGPASKWGAAQARTLRARGALGASDLGGALAWAKAHGAKDRVVLVTDGVATAGDTDAAALGKDVAAIGARRLDVVLAGGLRDDGAAHALARGLPEPGAVLDLAQGAGEVGRRLELGTRAEVAVAVEGATWVWPEHLDGLQPGDGATIYAALDKRARSASTLTITVGDHAMTVVPAQAPRPLVERAAAEAQVLRMEAQASATTDAKARASIQKDIVALSTRERVLSDETALLVLETSSDYARYGLDRRALADVMVVGEGGLELQHRAAPASIAAPDDMDSATASAGKARKKHQGDKDKDGDKSGEKVANEVLAKAPEKPDEATGKGTERDGRYADDKTLAVEDFDGKAGGDAPPAPGAHAEMKVTLGDLTPDEGEVALRSIERSSADGAGSERVVGSVSGGSAGAGGAGSYGVGAGRGAMAGSGSAVANGQDVPRTATPPPPMTAQAPAPTPEPVPAQPTSPADCRRAEHRPTSGATHVDLEARGFSSSDNYVANAQIQQQDQEPDPVDDDARDALPPWTGDYAAVMKAIGAGRAADALALARAWHAKDAGDVLGLVALGDALEATGDRAGAARAYGSIIDLFPSRADLRRFAGERLERIADRDPIRAESSSRALAIDTYRRAVEDRPDHLTGHRLLAYALVRAGRYDEALAAIERGIDQPYPSDRFRGGDRILREDLGLIGGAWVAAEPKRKDAIATRIAPRGGALPDRASTRFVLYWETDDNDVDFHIHDAHGGHAFYQRMHLRSGGDLYADVTTGYGPEEFAIQDGGKAGPYKLQIHYFSRGPMGYGMGTLEVIHADASGKLLFEHRPFIVMNDKAYVDLGSVKD